MIRQQNVTGYLTQQEQQARGRILLDVLVLPSLLAVLVWWAAGRGYLLAHTLAEVFSIVVAVTALVVATTAYRFTRNHFVIFVAVAIGWCAGLDIIHMLVFKGMQLLPVDSANPPTQLWIAARFIQALAMLVAPLLLTRQLHVFWLHLIFGSLSIAAVLAIGLGYFPDAYIDGQGLTPFKINTEYLIIVLFGVSLHLLWQRRQLISPRLLWWISASLLVMMASEFAFTRYASVYAQANLLGHILKIYAYWFVYLALVQTTLREPFSMLARAASTYDAVPDPVLVINADGTILQANRAAARLLGRTVEELVGGSSHAFFHQPQVPVAACPVCSRLAQPGGGFLQVLEFPGFRFVECNVAPYAENDDSVCVEVLRDVTEQHASEERFRKLFEDTRLAVTLVVDGRFVAANRAALGMLKMARLDDLLGRTPLDISPEYQPDGQRSEAGVEAVIAMAFARGGHEFEWQHLHADGSPFTTRVLLTPIRMGGKDVLHSVWTDITEQKKTERELHDYRLMLEQRVSERTAELEALALRLGQANAQQQAVFDAAAVGILLTRKRIITHCNRTLEIMFGYEENELLGKSTAILYPDNETFLQVGITLKELFASDQVFSRELEMPRKDGSRFLARLSIQAIDRSDPEKGVAGTITDITVERAAMDELSKARQMAEDLARAKADFLANMSHEIRTPMNSVIGMTHLALHANPPPKIRDYLNKIQISSKHLLGVINDILDFSKLDAAKMQLEHADFELEKVLENISSLFAEPVAGKGLEFLIDMAGDVPQYLVGDSLRLEQVLINLANNAVKFTERGSITIHVSLRAREMDRVELYFAVRDTGIGIGEAERARLFQSFQQADSSTTRKFGGSGLGLAISKRLVELMGGNIGVESQPGSGSTFWFTAHFGLGREGAVAVCQHASLHGLKALVVDDNAQARLVIVEMLREMGLQAVSAAGGQEALGELEIADGAGVQYDLVLLDWKMPGMDGVEVAREILRRPLQKQPIVMMVTAFDRDEVQSAAAQMGIREILVKPLTPSALFNGLLRHVGVAQASAPGAGSRSDSLAVAPELAGARVLLVEDNELNQEVAREFLEAMGLQVDIAADGLAGVRQLQEKAYDVVLMDMQMPVMDGLSATREIRRMPQFAGLPIIAMTANALPGDREQCLAAGMNDHIAKPIAPDDLFAKLNHWVHRSAGPAPAGIAALARRPPDGPYSGRLEDLPGVDVALGLSHVAGRQVLYRKVLGKFVSNQSATPRALTEAIASGRWEEAEYLAHTLKGVAAQIGASALQQQAAQFEQAIRARHDVAILAEQCQTIVRPLTLLLAALSGGGGETG